MKKIVRLFLTLVLGLVIATSSMLLVNCLPSGRMEENLRESAVIMEKEQDYHEVIPGMITSRLDNFTDSIMLTTSVYKADTGLIDRTINAYRVIYSEKSPSQTLVAYANKEEGYSAIPYSRYWHGYQVILKPMLLFFNYQEIRLINMLLQMFLVAGVVMELAKRKLKLYIIPYFVTLISIMPCSVMLSLQFSSVFYIMNIGIFVLLKYKEFFDRYDCYDIYFVIVGMLTGFMDFLTYPLITLGAVMVFYLILSIDDSFVSRIIDVIKYSIFWALGYAVMWSGKWIIGSIFLKKNIITDAINALINRTSSETSTEQITHLNVIEKNLETIFTTPVKYLFAGIIIICLAITVYKSIRNKTNYFKNWHYWLVACMPFAWYYVTANHSYIHFWFTYREFAIFILAILTWSISNIYNIHISERMKRQS